VLDSGYTNHMTGEKSIFTSFEKNDTISDSIIFGDNSQGNALSHGKIAITTNILSLKFLLNPWSIICYPFYNFVK
jgi:hypothetical protein